MATPEFGGTRGVPALDIGQDDSARFVSGAANIRLSVTPTTIDARVSESPMPQQAITFADVMGPGTGRVIWTGNLRVDSVATLDAIASDLERYVTGYPRTAGIPGAFAPAYIKATKLTDVLGRILSERARMATAQFTARPQRLTTGPFLYLIPLQLLFSVLR